jgi:Uma2 family endonuclease
MAAPHMSHVARLSRLFIETFGKRATVFIQLPILLSDDSEPEPDISVLKWRDDDYFSGKPGGTDVQLLVEVADTSLIYDRRTKLPLYARHGVPEVWILNLQSKQLEVYRTPQENDYAEKLMFKSGETLYLQAFTDISFAVSDILIQPR